MSKTKKRVIGNGEIDKKKRDTQKTETYEGGETGNRVKEEVRGKDKGKK